jgi:hypothetical protein
MKKSDREKLAFSCAAKIRENNLSAQKEGNWVVITPPEKVPSGLLMDMAKCANELSKILFTNGAVV